MRPGEAGIRPRDGQVRRDEALRGERGRSREHGGRGGVASERPVAVLGCSCGQSRDVGGGLGQLEQDRRRVCERKLDALALLEGREGQTERVGVLAGQLGAARLEDASLCEHSWCLRPRVDRAACRLDRQGGGHRRGNGRRRAAAGGGFGRQQLAQPAEREIEIRGRRGHPRDYRAGVNRLAGETSPYLLQHAGNPVDWYPWGAEALGRARDEDRPILLSIGYAACHWCHVMEHESFEDAETAALMNEHFVSVKVDREERPDLDSVYMDAVVALTGHGGWPMTVFLTPEGEPFFGGTYFPPAPRHGLPSFGQVLLAVAQAYRERRSEVAESARRLVEAVRASSELAPSSEPLTGSVLSEAARGLERSFDPEWGGFGGAPKFPPASTLEFLLRRGELEPVVKTLDAMAAGGMYDLVGGGFHRYSVDGQWLVPHFEKMLYDNALLVPVYLHAWVVTGEARYRRVAEETVEYMLRDLALPDGAFASSQDADTDGVEGLTYTWTEEEGVPAALLRPFEHGRSIIRGELDPELRARLLAERARRPQPGRDDKAIAAWNGLALAALAEVGRRFASDTVLQAARRLGEFLLGPLSTPDGRLHRTWRDGRATIPGYLEDYADVAHGLVELHVATGELHWLEEANRLARLAVVLFADDDRGGFFMTAGDAERLVTRKKDLDDNPVPSGNSMLAYVLLRLARIYGDDELERRAAGVLRLVYRGLTQAPSAFGWALCALDLYLAPPREVAIVGAPDDEVAGAALAGFEPNTVVAFGPSEAVPLLPGKTRVDGKPAVYVCERFACRAPVTDPAQLERQGQTP